MFALTSGKRIRLQFHSVINFDCTIQEGCITDEMRPRLAAAIEGVCVDVLGQDQGPVEVTWTVIRKGFGFRGGEPSTTSLVRGQIPDGCDKETRRRLLHALGDAWCETSGMTEHEVVVSARDQSWKG